jgi:hypothetical protein
MTGGGMALVTSEIINTSVQTLTWVQWAVLMLPPTVLLYFLATVGAVVLTGVGGTTTVDNLDRERVNTDGESVVRIGFLPRVTKRQHFPATSGLWAS